MSVWMSAQKLCNRPVRLIDRRAGISRTTRIRVRNGDPAESGPAEDMRLLCFGQLRVEQRVIFRSVAMGPAVYSDGEDVRRGVEPAIRERSGQLLPNVALE